MAGGVEKIWWTDLLSPFKEDILSGLPVTRALIAALPIWMSMDGNTWLVVDERESVRDKVYHLGEGGATLSSEEGGQYDEVDSGWMEWLPMAEVDVE